MTLSRKQTANSMRFLALTFVFGPVSYLTSANAQTSPKGANTDASWERLHVEDGITVWRDKKPNHGHMIRFIGTEGEVHVSRGKIATMPKELVRHQFTDKDIQVYESNNQRSIIIGGAPGAVIIFIDVRVESAEIPIEVTEPE